MRGVDEKEQSRDSAVIAGNFCSVVFLLESPYAVMFATPGADNLAEF